MGAITSQITSLTIVYSTVYSDADQRKHQSSASLAFVWGLHRGPVNSPHKWPVARKMFPFDDVILRFLPFISGIDIRYTSSWKAWAFLCRIYRYFDGTDALSPYIARVSAASVLTQLSRNILASVPEWIIPYQIVYSWFKTLQFYRYFFKNCSLKRVTREAIKYMLYYRALLNDKLSMAQIIAGANFRKDFPSWFKLDGNVIVILLHPGCNGVTAMEVFTWCDSCAVVICTKFCSDVIPYTKTNSIEFELWWKNRFF